MTQDQWINLNDYAIKYRVSISTLRRRIKDNSVEYQFENGKYWLRDGPLNKPHYKVKDSSMPPSIPMASPPQLKKMKVSPSPIVFPVPESSPLIQKNILNQGANNNLDSDTLTQLVQEIKKAYAIVLQEKEEQILLLKEEVTDLRTLVKVLEDQNIRHRSSMESLSTSQKSPTFIDWAFSLDNEK